MPHYQFPHLLALEQEFLGYEQLVYQLKEDHARQSCSKDSVSYWAESTACQDLP